MVYESQGSSPSLTCGSDCHHIPKTLRNEQTDHCTEVTEGPLEGSHPRKTRRVPTTRTLENKLIVTQPPPNIGWNLQPEPNLPAEKKIKYSTSFIRCKHNPESHNVIFKIFRIDSKITQHTKNHENFNLHRIR